MRVVDGNGEVLGRPQGAVDVGHVSTLEGPPGEQLRDADGMVHVQVAEDDGLHVGVLDARVEELLQNAGPAIEEETGVTVREVDARARPGRIMDGTAARPSEGDVHRQPPARSKSIQAIGIGIAMS